MGEDKLWTNVDGRPLIALTLDAVAAADSFDLVVIVAPHARRQRIHEMAAEAGLQRVEVTDGGDSRQESVAAGLALCREAEVVCVHDAARPLAPPGLFAAVIEAALRNGAATAAIPCVDTVKQVSGTHVVGTLDRSKLVATQTPQAFRTELLIRAHESAAEEVFTADDDAALVERLGSLVVVVPGDQRNLKVTTRLDLALLRTLMTVDGTTS